MTISARIFLPLFALGLVLGACKDDGASLDSGIDGAKQGDELTDAEKEQFCEAADAYGEQVLSDEEVDAAFCTLEAINLSLQADGSVDTCNTLRQSCLAEPEPEPEPGEDTCSLDIDWATCKATVSEVEACYEEFGQSFAARLRSFSCSKMAEYATATPSLDIESGPDCSLAKAKCPTVMGGG